MLTDLEFYRTRQGGVEIARALLGAGVILPEALINFVLAMELGQPYDPHCVPDGESEAAGFVWGVRDLVALVISEFEKNGAAGLSAAITRARARTNHKN